MRRSPSANTIQSLGELLEEHLRLSFMMQEDNKRPIDSRTTIGRLKHLREYADIARSDGAKIYEKRFGQATEWQRKNGFPALTGKNHRSGDQITGIELILRIVTSAESLLGLVLLLELWLKARKSKDITKLARLLIKTAEERMPVEEMSAAEAQQTNEAEEIAKDNIQIYNYLKEKQVMSKYKIDATMGEILGKIKPEPSRPHPTLARFKNVETAWYADYATFSPEFIAPYPLPADLEFDDFLQDESAVLSAAEDQLTKASHIMLRGAQPWVTKGEKDGRYFRYGVFCEWHVIATAFGQLVTDRALKLSFCNVCGIDIGERSLSARKCKSCYEKKRSR